ncbi:ankyrin repeat domain-containing protein [Roseivivax sp. GX 12232]|uniref:ankyrin repeat domain-containing protein n=1 Tax=Roseivivax sp. GX 12232 TaxID=2900547 RepID=UPI001E419194|nr:ankyrin repeat domain-containing protein [Roseivivax sp. GX 12232]MCE0504124.1 ankyrin repeat domain-containing protein [Roseivivax sp. GX 12232]
MGDTGAVETLLKAGANPNGRANGDPARRTIFAVAAARSDGAAIVSLLWQYGASPFILDSVGRRPIDGAHAATRTLLDEWDTALKPVSTALLDRWRSAAVAGDLETLCADFDRHRRFSLPASLQDGVLAGVVTQDVPPAVLHLLGRGTVEIDAAGRFGTPLQLAVASGRTEAVTALLRAGAAADTPDRFGRRSLMMAAAAGRRDIAAALLQAGANPQLRSGSQGTALVAAAFAGHAETMDVLLQGGASANASRDNGETALALAVSGGHAAAMRVLLRNAADPNGRDAMGRPAAVIAAQAGAFDLVSDLLAAKADPILGAPDGQTLLALLRDHNNRPVGTPGSVITPDVAGLSSHQDQILADAPPGPNRVDPVFPSELDADGDGGIGPPIAQYLDRLAQHARSEEHRALRTHFQAAPPDGTVDERLRVIADQERQFLARRAALRQQKDVLLADRARLSQTVLDLQAQLTRLDKARAAKRADVMARVAEFQALLNQYLQARQEVLSITSDLEALHEDFVMGNDARFDRLGEARRKAKHAASEISEEREIYASLRNDLRTLHSEEVQNLRGEVAERESRLRDELVELSEAERKVARAERLQSMARVALQNHLAACDAANEAQRTHCHNPDTCGFMAKRDSIETILSSAQSEVQTVGASIAQTRALLDDELRLFRIQRQSIDDQLARDLNELNHDERLDLRELEREYADAQTLIARHTVDFEARRALLEELAKERETHIADRYGPDHDRLYGAMVTFVGGWRSGRIVAGEALWGYAEIEKIGQSMDAAGISAPGFAEMRTVMAGLDLVWQIFGADHLAQLALSVALSDDQTRLQAAQDGLAGIAGNLDTLDRALDALRLEREELIAYGDGAAAPALEAALRLSDERIAVTKELLTEAFSAAAVRTLSATDLTGGTWGAELRQMTGKPWLNPLLRRVAELPQPVANGTELGDPKPDVLDLTLLTPAGAEGVIAAWLAEIDFDATAWNTAVPTQGNAALRAVFFAALRDSARFDRARFKAGGPPAYRLTTPQGSYWIREDGSLLSFLDTDVAPLFEYAFTVPAGTLQGDILRSAYADFVSGMKGGFAALPPERKRLAVAIEAALRTFDQKEHERLVVAAGDGLKDMVRFLVSAAPAGQFVTITSVVFDYATSDELGFWEAVFTVGLERWGWNSLSKFRPITLRAFYPNSEEAAVEVAKVLIKDGLFHQDRLIGGLGLHDEAQQLEVQRQAETLRVLLSQAADFVEAEEPAPPTTQSRWSRGAPVIEARLAAPVILTRLANTERELYVTGTVTPQRLQRLERCLGLDLEVELRRSSVTGAIFMGVARNEDESCMVIIEP